MIILLYDLTATQPTPDSKFHGGGTYAEIIFYKLIQDYKNYNCKIYGAFDSKRYIDKNLLNAAKENNIEVFDINNTSIKDIFTKYNINRFYSALLDERIPWPLDIAENITTVHGLRSLEMPIDNIIYFYELRLKEKIKSWLKLNILSKKYFNKVKKGYERFFTGKFKIITVSQHSKASIINFFPHMGNEDIKVFSSPTFDQLNIEQCKTEYNELLLNELGIKKEKYFILTSSARWIKNNIRAVIALDSLYTHNKNLLKDFKVVLTGVSNKKIYLNKIKNKDKFVLLDYINRYDLEFLEKNAHSFIYPSLNEGFGYPPIESMKFKVPVIASGSSSIPEVCGDAVLYFDPYSISEIKNRIIQILDKSIYTELKEKMNAQYKKISDMQNKDLNNMINFLLSK